MSSEIDAREQNPCFESEFESGAKDIKKIVITTDEVHGKFNAL